MSQIKAGEIRDDSGRLLGHALSEEVGDGQWDMHVVWLNDEEPRTE